MRLGGTAVALLIGCSSPASDGGASNAGGSGGMSGGAGGASSSGGSGGLPGAGGASGGTSGSCLATPLLGALGKSTVLVGASMTDATATAAPFDLRYRYISGGLADGAGPCTRCDVGCTSGGVSCANTAGCAWWGCWQYDQDPPGGYVRGIVSTDQTNGQIPMLTWYEVLQASGVAEGSPEVAVLNDAAFTARYLADYAFFLDQIGQATAFVHIEPDFWGYAEQVNEDPHAIPAAVGSAYSGCAGFEDSIAGLGRCMIALARAHAPNARVGLHGSAWGTKMDVLLNAQASFDVAGEAQKLGAFLTAAGAADGDFVVVDASDRDAAWYATQGRDTWWDDTNATLPNFTQAFTWAGALAESVGKPIVWWQVPVGNPSLPNTNQEWQDNRVDYFMTHMSEVATAHGVAVLFGAGDGAQTTPETDGGNLVNRVTAYAGARAAACP